MTDICTGLAMQDHCPLLSTLRGQSGAQEKLSAVSCYRCRQGREAHAIDRYNDGMLKAVSYMLITELITTVMEFSLLMPE